MPWTCCAWSASGETPLDVAEVVAALDDEAAGGLTLFVGRVRDHDGGRDVTGLEYSAHPTAVDRLREVCAQVAADVRRARGRRRPPGRTPRDRRRRGHLRHGPAHRGEAFEATRALIDTLKAEVPIWKHQLFADGTEEWVGSP